MLQVLREQPFFCNFAENFAFMDIRTAAQDIVNKVHAYMRAHPDSELHQQGKMFGVLVCRGEGLPVKGYGYIAAFSAMLDGSYHHEGFVPPIYECTTPPVGTNQAESRRLQQLLFANYSFLNGQGESKSLTEIFANEKPILIPEEWFNKGERGKMKGERGDRLPPSGAGECCAPKLLQYALQQGWEPVALAEFWVGAPSRTEIRREGVFYAPCSGKCVPILNHMLKGLDVTILSDAQALPSVLAPIERIYEDEWLMVVNKPAGMLSVPGKSDEPSVASVLTEQCGSPVMPVHRLDQDTSGLLVLAKNADVYRTLQAYFQRRDILKRYEAVVKLSDVSRQLSEEGTIALPLLPDPFDRPRQTVNREHGKPAITRYVLRERRADGAVLVDFYPQTGRTHQLRIHATHPDGLNAPIIGDRLYGGKTASRLMLHAAEIRFVHPVTKEEMHFCIPSLF